MHVFDLAGRRVRTLVDRTLGPGRHLVAWDGRNETGTFREEVAGSAERLHPLAAKAPTIPEKEPLEVV